APVQCNGGGHPIASGLDSIDCFFSSALMEPENGQEHYTERLILLPNLASCYPAPRIALTQDPEGYRPGAVNYVNLQSLFKLLPGDDALYARIARQVPGSRFHFIGWTRSVTEAFRHRLRRAFAAHGLDADLYCEILPRMPQERFFGLAKAADVILDGLDWSGNNSSLEALALDAPIVTLPGPFFRSRHTCGIFRRMGLMETVATTREEYIAIAVRLGLDRAFRERMRQAIAQAKGRLYEDESVPAALGAWLEALAAGGREGQSPG
ncbi:MAG: glycosyltransferase, partial [Magnetococcales bacterium]|nr:glycosyltransferase [Magnetococcales bacterium]